MKTKFTKILPYRVSSNFSYSLKHKSLKTQANAYRRLMPDVELDFGYLENYISRFKINKSELLLAPKRGVFSGDYYRAVRKILDLHVKERRGFKNYKADKLIKDFLFLDPKTEFYLKKLESFFKGNFIVLQAKGGEKYAGCSISKVRESMAENEFGMDIFYGTCYMLIHPERIKTINDLAFNMPGNSFTPIANGIPHKTLYYQMLFGDILELGTYWEGFVSPVFGSLTGYWPY